MTSSPQQYRAGQQAWPAAGWIDLSVPVRTGMPYWPDNPPVLLERAMDISQGDECNVSRLEMGVHSGTHVDAPVHFIHGAAAVEEMTLATGIGEARVIEIADPVEVTAVELAAHAVQPGERVLLKTANSPRCWQADEFLADYVGLTEEAARYLADVQAALVGIDYLSIGAPGSDVGAVHRILLGADVWIVEGLDLTPVTAGRYELLCLPVRLQGSDGSPARVVARPLP
ncbi:MAG TPA: cyclase family protein [Streptosporangiaceae bacterium]|jgi:arylformamidase